MTKKSAAKPASKTSARKKATRKKVAPKEAPARKAAPKTSARKKAAPKKAPARKAAPKTSARKKADSKTTIAKRAKALADSKVAAEGKPKAPAQGFSMDDVRQILLGKTSDSVSDEKTQKTKSRKGPKKKAKEKKKKFTAASVADILGFNPNQRKTPEQRREAKVPKKFLSYYRILIKLREELKEGLDSHSQGTLLTSSQEESGDLSANSSDSGSEAFNRDVALSMVASEQDALQEVEAAIERIFDGTFGICQETGKQIKRDRLKAVPFTRFSIEGQSMHEQGTGRQVQRGGIFTNLSESVPGMEPHDDT